MTVTATRVSAASYVLEPLNLFSAADGKLAEVVTLAGGSEAVTLPGLEENVPVGDMFVVPGGRFSDPPAAVTDPQARIDAMDESGVDAAILYPNLLLRTYVHPDSELQEQWFARYRTWVTTFASTAPKRLRPVFPSTACSPEQVYRELDHVIDSQFAGLLLPNVPPNDPGAADYPSDRWDTVWQRLSESETPVSFHVAASPEYRSDTGIGIRLPNSAFGAYNLTRNVQQVVNVFIQSEILDRFPGLRLVLVGGDASWAPHYSARMNHWFQVQAPTYQARIRRLPADCIHENVWFAINDDVSAFRMKHEYNFKKLLWADFFPGPDWEASAEDMATIDSLLSANEREQFYSGNAVALYYSQHAFGGTS
jgi:uncharacterized protein